MTISKKPLVTALGAACVFGSAAAGAGVFQATELSAGYQLAADAAKRTEAKPAEAKCGEGACGAGMKAEAAAKTTDAKKADPAKTPEAKAAEGACGAGKATDAACGGKH